MEEFLKELSELMERHQAYINGPISTDEVVITVGEYQVHYGDGIQPDDDLTQLSYGLH